MAQEEGQNGGAEKTVVEVSFKSVKPQLFVEAPKATDAIQFYKAAFGAVETCRSTQPKRKADQELPHIVSAVLQLAGSTFIVADLSDDSSSYVSLLPSLLTFMLLKSAFRLSDLTVW
ncbi:hypothetical protein OIU78_010983 [Salix suchowensis]|nr:hypothetical protein OIU78_010983 [Salix suchowensis]